MPTLIIDGKEITVPPGTSIMEAARRLGVRIPHFCYHPKLSVAGNCRVCLVGVEKMPRPVPACAMPVGEGMVVSTSSPAVEEARRGVMEMLLINHPLDCPSCDQGGECDLQDYAMKYGPDRARFHEEKRQTPDHDLGPLIETVMNRCIHCTRCIRFSEEISGVEEMGAVWRGDHMAVGPYVQKSLSSELSGNLAELCPVGALNLKPYHFQARSWELRNAFGICNHCAVGCHVRRDHQNGVVKRVMADSCDAINETWLCDKGRFAYDGLTVDRLEYPQWRSSAGLHRITWQEALDRVAELLKGVKPEEVAGLADDRQAAEDLFAFQDLLRNAIGTLHLDHRLRQRDFSADQTALTRADLLMNTPLANLPQADVVLLIGCDPRQETPILNLRLRKAAQAGAKVWALYPRRLDSNVPGLRTVVTLPGSEGVFLEQVLDGLAGGAVEGDAATLAAALRGAQRPVVLVGDYAIGHPRAESLRRQAVAVMAACNALSGEWKGYNRVRSRGNAAAAQDLGVVPHRGPGYARLDKVGKNAREILEAAAAGEIKVLFLLGSDPILEAVDAGLARQALKKAKVIYLGAFRTPAIDYAELLLPGVAISEKEGSYTNCEGRVQRSGKAAKPPGEAKEEWQVLRALSDRFPSSLGYNTLAVLRAAMAAADHRYQVSDPGEMRPPCDHSPVTPGLPSEPAGMADEGVGMTLVAVAPLYADDPVARRSATLAKLDQGSVLRINPTDAAQAGIGQGQRVRLIQGDKTLDLDATLDGGLPRGVVMGSLGYDPGLIQDLTTWQGEFPKVSVTAL